jgi:hypothetical protein
LPRDEGAKPAATPPPTLRVLLTRAAADAPVRRVYTSEGAGREGPPRQAPNAGARALVEVDADPPGGPIPYHEVFRALRDLRASGIEDVRFASAPPTGR